MATASESAMSEPVSWRPEGAGDFAQVAWLVAEAMGNGAGVRALDVARHNSRITARVWTISPEYVRAVAARFGWQLHEPDAGYATTWGPIGDVHLNVIWIQRADVEQTPAAG